MSQIRTAKAVDVGAFPGSTFVVNGTPPIAQCEESSINFLNATTTAGGNTLTKIGISIGIDLSNKTVTIAAPPLNAGDYIILSNTDDVLTLATTTPNASAVNTGNIKDTGQAYLTRNESSFQRFIESEGKAHTTKGGQLFTDIADPPMDDACSNTFNPA